LVLRRAGDDAQLGYAGGQPTYKVNVMPGQYDAYCASGDNVGDQMRNANNRISGPVSLSGSTATLNYDVPVTGVTATATVNGLVATAGIANISLRRASTLATPSLGWLGPSDDANIAWPSQTMTDTAHVIPGTYDVYYESSAANTAESLRN